MRMLNMYQINKNNYIVTLYFINLTNNILKLH